MNQKLCACMKVDLIVLNSLLSGCCLLPLKKIVFEWHLCNLHITSWKRKINGMIEFKPLYFFILMCFEYTAILNLNGCLSFLMQIVVLHWILFIYLFSPFIRMGRVQEGLARPGQCPLPYLLLGRHANRQYVWTISTYFIFKPL